MKALIFDMDDTLYARITPFQNACRQMFDGRFALDYTKLHDAFSLRGNEVFEDAMNQKITMEEMYIYRTQKALADCGISISEKEALDFQAVYAWHLNHISLSENFASLLDDCVANDLFLAMITNGPSEHQRKKYRALGLDHWFPESVLLASGDINANKPDLEIFRTGEQRWNLIPEDTWFIGDSYSHDIEGASAAGWHSIWLDRSGQAKDMSKNLADITVATEEELTKAIRQVAGLTT